jgi:aldehyde dehydrogenase (NAD+)
MITTDHPGAPAATARRLEAPGLFIDGRWVEPKHGGRGAVIDPATEAQVGEAPVATAPDVVAALSAARKAFDHGPWGTYSVAERTAAMRRFEAAVHELETDIVDAMAWEAGVVRSFAAGFLVPTSNNHLAYAISTCERGLDEPVEASVVPLPGGASNLACGTIVHDPVGVVVAIVPFNGPHLLTLGKLAGALATGNTVVLKPSPFTPFGALVLARAAEMADLPPGVLNVVTGGAEEGALLTGSPLVDMISFTGSDTVGAAIMAQAAPALSKVVLELGGKSAQIVLEDADLQAAVAAGTANYLGLAGQGCSHRTRHLVHRSVYDEYLQALADCSDSQVIGDPDGPATTMGPLISAAQRERTERYVAIGLEEGATLVTGGSRPDHLPRGYYYRPTVLTDVKPGARVAQEEIFGPVAVVIPFDSDDEAVRIANDSCFGLSGVVWSRNTGRAFAVARRVRAGQVHINGGTGAMSPNAPFGGYKRSGLGREYGRQGLLEYTETKYIGFKAG